MDRSAIRVDAQTETTQIRSRRLTPMPLDFFVGAYPPTGKYDECTELDDHKRAIKIIRSVWLPRRDPVYGTTGPLSELAAQFIEAALVPVRLECRQVRSSTTAR
jgi:hypothetical protein